MPPVHMHMFMHMHPFIVIPLPFPLRRMIRPVMLFISLLKSIQFRYELFIS